MTASGLFERTRILVGDEGVERLRAAHVFLVGVGGVGGFAAEALGRAGIGRLTLLDHDIVEPSDVNRQLPATTETLGRKKVALVGQRLQAINPECRLELMDTFLNPDNTGELLDRLAPDRVVDAIDSLNCKVGLIVEAWQRRIPVFSSMGAAGRLDPSAIRVGDIMDTTVCNLAREVRSRLRRRGVGRGVTVVWSCETAAAHLPPAPVSSGRDRAVNGSISYLPALFGLMLAGNVIRSLLTPAPLAESRHEPA
ncbi:MAG: tRNA threonylcarbamoyladenosine dehydratase [Magnetococcales bacterium]|nr:tRNA threonylcarbamoyladenosine dehydratase [Magnetococcales bacterium]